MFWSPILQCDVALFLLATERGGEGGGWYYSEVQMIVTQKCLSMDLDSSKSVNTPYVLLIQNTYPNSGNSDMYLKHFIHYTYHCLRVDTQYRLLS